METVTDYKILKDKNLIIEYYAGEIKVEDVIALKETQAGDKDYNPNYNIIDDFRDADFVFTPKEVQKYVDYVRNVGKNYGKRKTAFLTKSPRQVAMLTLFDTTKGDLPIDAITCSTLIPALEHVGLDAAINKSLVEKILESFGGTFTD